MWGLWLGGLFYHPTWQLTHLARTIPTQLAVAWYFLLNCALAPIQWVTRPCLDTWAPKAAVASFHVESEVPTNVVQSPTSLELTNAFQSKHHNRRPRRIPLRAHDPNRPSIEAQRLFRTLEQHVFRWLRW